MIPAFLRRLPRMPENEHGKLAYRALPPIEKEKPLVSVLTPVHDMPLELLGRAARSLAAQDYDRERGEWMIAVHNMDEDYLERVQKTVGDSPRIHVFPVKEPKGVLGAVRNALLDGAQGRYVFWLDGDDELLPGCLSRAVEFMEQSRSDMLLFPCKEIREGEEDTFPRVLNYGSREPAVYEQGDPRLGELLVGCGLDVWSWCFRSSFLREAGVCFDEEEVGHLGDPLFVTRVIALARRVAVLPGGKGYAYHFRNGSDSQERIWSKEKALLSCREMICVMRKAIEQESFDLHRFLWRWLANACFIFQSPAVGGEERRRIREALLPYVGRLRVLAPCPAVSADRAQQMADFVEQLFPEAAEEFRQPRYGHRQAAFLSLPSAEEITARIRALDYIGCKTLPEGESVYLGKAEDAAAPEVAMVDLRKQGEQGKEATERQLSLIEGYGRMEELRGFGLQEVPCRVTLFLLGEASGRILVTWDERFLHHSFAEWLLKEIC